MAMELFQLKIPKATLIELPIVAARHNMTVPQLVRVILNLVTSGRIELTITQEVKNERPSLQTLDLAALIDQARRRAAADPKHGAILTALKRLPTLRAFDEDRKRK